MAMCEYVLYASIVDCIATIRFWTAWRWRAFLYQVNCVDLPTDPDRTNCILGILYLISLSLSQSFSHFSFLFSLFLTCFLSLFLPPFILFLFRSFAFSFSLFLPARETIQIGVRVDHWRKSMVGGFFYLWACPTLCPVRNCYNRVWATMDWLRLRQPPPILVPNPGTFPLFVWWKLLSRGENE